MKNKYISTFNKIFKIVFLLLSFLFFIKALISSKTIDIVLAVPFIIFIICLIHELGHLFGCVLTKSKIKEVKIMFFKISKEGISFLNKVILGGSVCFSASSSRKSKIIYMFGPIFSVILLIGSIIIYLITFNKLLIAWIIISILSVIFMLLPIKGSDIYNILKKERGVFNG